MCHSFETLPRSDNYCPPFIFISSLHSHRCSLTIRCVFVEQAQAHCLCDSSLSSLAGAHRVLQQHIPAAICSFGLEGPPASPGNLEAIRKCRTSGRHSAAKFSELWWCSRSPHRCVTVRPIMAAQRAGQPPLLENRTAYTKQKVGIVSTRAALIHTNRGAPSSTRHGV
jgi:hypothetical protein